MHIYKQKSIFIKILFFYILQICIFHQNIYTQETSQQYEQYHQFKIQLKIQEESLRLNTVQQIISSTPSAPFFKYLLLEHLPQEENFVIQQSILAYLDKKHQLEDFTPLFNFIQNTWHQKNLKTAIRILLSLQEKIFFEKIESELSHYTQYAIICPLIEVLHDLEISRVKWTQKIWKQFQLYSIWKEFPLSKEIACIQNLPANFFSLQIDNKTEKFFLYLHFLMYQSKKQHTEQIDEKVVLRNPPKKFFQMLIDIPTEKQNWVISYLLQKKQFTLNQLLLQYQTSSILSWITRNFNMLYPQLTSSQLNTLIQHSYKKKKLTTLYSIIQTLIVQNNPHPSLIRLCREQLYVFNILSQTQKYLNNICIYLFLQQSQHNKNYQQSKWKQDLHIIKRYLQKIPSDIAEQTIFDLLENILETEICNFISCTKILLLSTKRNIRRKMWLLSSHTQHNKSINLDELLYHFETDPLIYRSKIEQNK